MVMPPQLTYAPPMLFQQPQDHQAFAIYAQNPYWASHHIATNPDLFFQTHYATSTPNQLPISDFQQ